MTAAFNSTWLWGASFLDGAIDYWNQSKLDNEKTLEIELTRRVQAFVTRTFQTCTWPIIGSQYTDQERLNASMKLRKQGADLLDLVKKKGSFEDLVCRIDLATRRLIQFEKKLVLDCNAALKPIEVDGKEVKPGVSLIDDAVFNKLQTFVSDLEMAAYGTAYLYKHRAAGFPNASTENGTGVQATLFTRDSLNESVKIRFYAYHLIQVLLQCENSKDLILRVEAALDCMFKHEEVIHTLKHSVAPPLFFAKKVIFPGVGKPTYTPEAEIRNFREQKQGFEIAKVADPAALPAYVKAIKEDNELFFT